MTPGPLDFQDVLRLVELIKSSSNFSEMRLRSGDVEIELRRHGADGLAPPTPPAAALPASPAPAPMPAPASTPPSTPSPRSNAAPAQRPLRAGETAVTAPMVGTVYLAPEPGARPFVQVGQTVAPDDPVCIVEVMKLMNSIPAGCHGVVTEVLVPDGQAVAHGQALFVIEKR